MSKRLPHEEQVISDAAVQDFRVRNYRDNHSRDKYKKRVIVDKDDNEIINDIFQVTVSIEGAGDFQNVMIYWEDNGYNNYHDYGLYGAYSTAYYRMKYGDGKLIIYGDGYTVTVLE
ncbi:MAG: hypothetical protein LUH55_06310 [Bacteroides thetaiotaomicron]|nr:hypothetical protein [Bacteroides thetaiotaomicron]